MLWIVLALVLFIAACEVVKDPMCFRGARLYRDDDEKDD